MSDDLRTEFNEVLVELRKHREQVARHDELMTKLVKENVKLKRVVANSSQDDEEAPLQRGELNALLSTMLNERKVLIDEEDLRQREEAVRLKEEAASRSREDDLRRREEALRMKEEQQRMREETERQMTEMKEAREEARLQREEMGRMMELLVKQQQQQGQMPIIQEQQQLQQQPQQLQQQPQQLIHHEQLQQQQRQPQQLQQLAILPPVNKTEQQTESQSDSSSIGDYFRPRTRSNSNSPPSAPDSPSTPVNPANLESLADAINYKIVSLKKKMKKQRRRNSSSSSNASSAASITINKARILSLGHKTTHNDRDRLKCVMNLMSALAEELYKSKNKDPHRNRASARQLFEQNRQLFATLLLHCPNFDIILSHIMVLRLGMTVQDVDWTSTMTSWREEDCKRVGRSIATFILSVQTGAGEERKATRRGVCLPSYERSKVCNTTCSILCLRKKKNAND